MKKISFRLNIAAIFTALIIGTTALIITFNYIRSAEIIEDSSDRITRFASERIISETLNFLEIGREAVRLLHGYLDEVGKLQEKDDLYDFMWNILLAKEPLASLYIGDELGNFYQVRRTPELATRILERSQGSITYDRYEYRSENFQLRRVEETRGESVTYDPRRRPWYQMAGAPGSYWTDLYIFSSTGKPGITVSMPYSIDGRRQGVVAADITLDRLSTFLKENRVQGSGSRDDQEEESQESEGRTGEKDYGLVWIFNQGGQIVAYPEPSQAIISIDGKLEPASILNLEDTYVREGYESYLQNPRERFQYGSEGQIFIATFLNFPPDFGRRWKIGTIIPGSEVFGPVWEIMIQTIIISIGIVIFSLFVILSITKAIADPIVQLTEVAEKIRSLYLDIPIPVGSHIREIFIMQNAMVGMRGGLAAFAKYIPRDLVRELISKGQEAQLGGKEKDLTIFFSDITGFSGISESLSAGELMLYLSEYLEEMTKVIRAHGGTVDKYIGDGIMAFWGAPNENNKHPEAACKAALECEKRLEEYKEKWKREGKPPFTTRIGIHTGSTIIGNVGSKERMNYTIIGDSVNIAARLVELSKDYGSPILISGATRERLPETFITKSLGKGSLKGKTEMVDLYELKEG